MQIFNVEKVHKFVVFFNSENSDKNTLFPFGTPVPNGLNCRAPDRCLLITPRLGLDQRRQIGANLLQSGLGLVWAARRQQVMRLLHSVDDFH